jgi:hypothetical protein
MSTSGIIAIVGAGPYGLSLAAHLDARAIPYRIFGRCMRPWQDCMPRGMFLKSDGASSSLSHPDGEFPIEQFYDETGRVFRLQAPIPLDSFIAYGQAFQRRYVPALDTREVIEINRDGSRYLVRLDDGEVLPAATIVLAVGVLPFHYVPPALHDLPAALLTHASAYGPVSALRGREVAVIGSGASAIDLAVALHEHGAGVRIFSRRPNIAFQHPPSAETPSLLHRIRAPDCGIGAGWTLKFCADLPGLFHALPEQRKIRMTTTYLGPAPGWFMRERVEGHIPILLGMTPERAWHRNGRVHLQLRTADGAVRGLSADHVVAATGYRVDLARLGFLAPALRDAIRTSAAAPALSRAFETSVSGLHVIGPAAAMSFGPVMRFVYGADFTARRLAAHLAAARTRRHAVPPYRQSDPVATVVGN